MTERWRWLAIAIMAVCLSLGLIRQADAAQELAQLDALAGRFEQRIEDTDGAVISRSRGEFALLKPDYVRWYVQSPGEQLLLSDGEYLWQHDLDLETVSRQSLDRSADSPLRLLMATDADLAERYHIDRDSTGLTLTPLEGRALFQSLRIRFDGATPERLVLIDNLSQTVTIDLDVEPDRQLRVEDFRFETPPGTEITVIDTPTP